MYGREVDGKVTTFGTTGYTYKNVFLLYDRSTQTVWYPLGEAGLDGIGGPRQSDHIEFIEKPKIVSLGEWRRSHPETLVLLEDESAVDGIVERAARRGTQVR